MALNFPSNPTLNQYWVDPSNLVTYKWNGFVWTSIGGAVGDQGPQGFQGAASTVPGPQGVQGVQGGNWTRTGTTIAPKITGDVVKISAGTAALPGLTPVGDPNTGIYSPGADQVAVSTGGAARLFVNAIGRVGIGTVSPTYTLDVAGSCRVGAPNTSTAILEIGVGATGDRTSYIDLVGDTTYSDFGLRLIRSGGANADSELRHRGTGNLILNSQELGAVSFKTNNTERVRIDSAGLVGIGTTSPQVPLEVYRGNTEGDILRLSGSTDGNFRGLTFSTEATGGFSGALHRATIESGAGTFAFSILTGEKVRIDSSGRLLVGTSTSIDTRNYVNNNYGGPRLQQHGTTQATAALAVYNWGNNIASPASVTLSKSLGGAVGTRGALTVAGQDIGTITFTGDDGTKFIPAAVILAEVDGTPGTNDMPGRLVFSTTADGAASPTERMRIKSSGIINFSSTPVYADNAAASAGGLVAGDVYRKADGTLMITF